MVIGTATLMMIIAYCWRPPQYYSYDCHTMVMIANVRWFWLVYIHDIFSCDQAALRTVQSICLSVCLSVTPFSLCYHHRIVMKFSGVITIEKSDVHAKGQGQRSKVKVTEVKTQFSRFRTVTPVWICIWWWNDAQMLMLLRKGVLLFFTGHPSNFKVTRDHKSPILTRIERFRMVTPAWIYWWLWNYAQSLKQHRRGALLFIKVIHQISRSHRTKNRPFWPELSVSGL